VTVTGHDERVLS